MSLPLGYAPDNKRTENACFLQKILGCLGIPLADRLSKQKYGTDILIFSGRQIILRMINQIFIYILHFFVIGRILIKSRKTFVHVCVDSLLTQRRFLRRHGIGSR